jgi:dihydroxyacetone kinase DhaKLM complex PTS-EIIA-like component DhaM
MFLSIEVHEDLKLFKIDIGSAFLQTPMADDMKHKSVRLDPLVVNILMDLKLAVYELYVLQDGIS